MTAPERIARPLRFFPFAVRYAAIALVWLLAVGIGTACFFPPGASFPPAASEDWFSFDNALVFGSSTAVAGAVATSVALAVGGRRKWALDVAFAVGAAVAVLIVVAYTCLWLAPPLARSQMGYWEFVRLRQTMLHWATAIVRYQTPLGAVVGMLLGALAGLLTVLARRRPRIALGLLVGLLVAGASEPVQRLAFGFVLFWGQGVRWLVVSPGMTDPYVPASGATAGAIAGAIIAAVVMRRERARPSSDVC